MMIAFRHLSVRSIVSSQVLASLNRSLIGRHRLLKERIDQQHAMREALLAWRFVVDPG